MLKGILETKAETDQEFIELALTFGSPIKSRKDGGIIDTIIASESDQVDKDSLTKRYGLNQFPIHTDCAYLKQPPKYILLRYVGNFESLTPTILVHFDFKKLTEDELDFITRIVWFVKSSDNGFYSTIFKDKFIRYDIDVMKMVNPSNNKMETILSKMETSEIKWKKDKVVVIDNYTTLHYRPKVLQTENNNRILQRINIL